MADLKAMLGREPTPEEVAAQLESNNSQKWGESEAISWLDNASTEEVNPIAQIFGDAVEND